MSDTKHTTDMNDFWIELDGEDVRETVCDLLLDETTQGVDYCDEVASRIVDCVNACEGMGDPIKEIASLRARIAVLEQTHHYDQVDRGFEIQQWIDDNNIKCYCIIDDDNDMLPSQKNNFVRTANNQDHPDCIDIGYGLTRKCAERVVEILNKTCT
jgi:hypothetical protein